MFQVIVLNKKEATSIKNYANEGMARLCAKQFAEFGSKAVLKNLY